MLEDKKTIEKEIEHTLKMVERRRKAIDKSSKKAIETQYKVNDLAKKIHPNLIKAKVIDIVPINKNAKFFYFESFNKKFPFFRAGQFITLSVKINGHVITRPYSIASSPNFSKKGVVCLIIQKAGYFSNYVNDSLRKGDEVLLGEPSGDFYYDSNRDEKHIFAIAGGSGVTPFISMIHSIEDKIEDFKITLLYGVKTKKDILFELTGRNIPNVKIIPVFSDEEVEGFEHGLIDKNIIKKYMPSSCSIFVCGSNNFYSFIIKEFLSLGVDIHAIRKEHNMIKSLNIPNPKMFNLTLHMREKIFLIKASEAETILTSLERAGIHAPSRCRAGHCGFCHSRLIKGDIFIEKENDGRRAADKVFNYFHICASYPRSDLEIDVPPQDTLKEL